MGVGSGPPPWDKPLQNRRHRQRLQFGTREVLLGVSRAGNGEGGMLFRTPLRAAIPFTCPLDGSRWGAGRRPSAPSQD